MREIRLSPLAEADLEGIWLYTARTWSPAQAEKYHADMVLAFSALAAGSLKGRSVDIRQGYFKYPVGSHLIFYKQHPDGVDVIRILHQRMDIGRHL